MGTVLVNYSGKTRRATINGREYLVARATLIVPGVLNGSKGALYYPPDEVAKNHDAWNGIPLTNGHPSVNGANVSARSPDIIQSHGLGHVYNVNVTKNGRLRGEAWFDVKSCERVRPEILNKLKAGEPIELSTGLFTEDKLAENGAHHNGRKYTHIARNYRPDHLAILLDEIGACSRRDGCGVLVDNLACVLNESNVCLNCGGKGGKPGPCPSGKKKDKSLAKMEKAGLMGQMDLSDYDDVELKAEDLSPHEMTLGDFLKKHPGDEDFAKAQHRAAIDDMLSFKGTVASEVLKDYPDLAKKYKIATNCSLNASNVCTNCGGKGGKPGPCPSGITKRDTNLDTPIGSDPEQASRAHKLGTDATNSTFQLLNSGTMGQKPNATSRNAITGVVDLTRRVNKRAITGSQTNVGQTGKAVVQAQKAHEKATQTLLDAAQSDPGAAYELRKAAAKHDLAAKSFGAMAGRMKPTGNSDHEPNAAGVCVNCGGEGGTMGPCPKGKAYRAAKKYLRSNEDVSSEELTEALKDAGLPKDKAAEVMDKLFDRGLLEAGPEETVKLGPTAGKRSVGAIKGYLAEQGSAKGAELVEVLKDSGLSKEKAEGVLRDLKHSGRLRKKPTGNAMAHTLNAAGFCVNCGGKGGKPGPCPTGDGGDDAASIKRQISEHKKDMKARGIRVTSFMNGGLTADESRANAKLFELKTKLEGATKKGAGSATHVKDFLKTHDVTPEGFSAFGPQTKQAVVEKYNAANKTKLSVDDFHKLTTNSHSGDDMATKKEKMVAFLTANCDCWKGEGDAEVLANFDEPKLKTLIDATKRATANDAALNEIREGFGAEAEGLTANAMPAFIKAKAAPAVPTEDEEMEEEAEAVPPPPMKKGKKKVPAMNQETETPAKPPTLNEWLASAPVEVQEMVSNARAVEKGAKEAIVKKLVGNSSAKSKADRESLAAFLMAKGLPELNQLSKLSVNRAAPAERDPMDFLTAPTKKAAPAVNYGGMGEDFDDDEPTGNAEDTWLDAPLAVPTVNWAEEAKLIPTGARRSK